MADTSRRPAFYAAGPGRWRDWWNLLHPPYTAWHLAYVVIGASLAPHTDAVRLTATVLAFFGAVGIAAHAFDEVNGHPLRTAIPDAALWSVATAGLAGSLVLGVLGIGRVGFGLLIFMVIGPLVVVGYNLELLGGRLHTDTMFALGWGTFPVLTGYFAQAQGIGIVAVFAGAAAFALSYAQRTLSTPARLLRRHVTRVDGTLVLDDGSARRLDRGVLLEPLERALHALAWSTVGLAVAMAVARLR